MIAASLAAFVVGVVGPASPPVTSVGHDVVNGSTAVEQAYLPYYGFERTLHSDEEVRAAYSQYLPYYGIRPAYLPYY